jgi:tetratricopeptide (TPR) repeat protein
MSSDWQQAMERGAQAFGAGDAAGAADAFREAAEIAEGDPARIAAAQTNRGRALLVAGDIDTAEASFKAALAAWQKAPQPDKHGMGLAAFGLAQASLERDDLAFAVLHCRHAIQLYEKSIGADHVDMAAAINLTGFILFLKGDFGGAEPLVVRALSVFERHLGRDHPDALETREFLAAIRERLKPLE